MSMRLAEDVALPAGSRIPLDYMRVQSTIPSDTPLSSSYIAVIPNTLVLVTASSWVIPAGLSVSTYRGPSYGSGTTLPAGSRVASMSAVPAGTVVPSSVFPTGIPITPILLAAYKAGDVLPTALTLRAGTLVPVGTRFSQDVAIVAPLVLDPGLFSSGFSNYRVSSNTGVEVAAAVAATVPVYRFDDASATVPTGSRAREAAELWLPPTYLDDPVTGRFTRRAGASLSMSSLYDFSLAPGASITVDPGQAVSIYANRQTTIEGDITAHGGSINVASVPNAANGVSYNDGYGLLVPTRSIWIGDRSTLDVSAQAVTGTDLRGGHYGIVPTGGAITLGGSGSVASDAFVIMRPGARLDASGTTGLVDVGTQAVMVASDGGSISLYSASGLYIDGELRAAAGGAGASGGLLSLNVLSHSLMPFLPTPAFPFAIGEIPDEMQKLRNITIVQNSPASTLAADLAPGARDAGLKFGEAVIGVDKIHAGGFGQLVLATRDIVVFSGNVDLAMQRSIVLSGGVIGISQATPHAQVDLAAPYVKLDGWANDVTPTIAPIDRYYTGLNTVLASSLYTAYDSSLRVDAALIDLAASNHFGVHGRQGSGSIFFDGISSPANKDARDASDNESSHLGGRHIVDAPGFANVVLHSTGDVRMGTGELSTQVNLTIDAAQLYPLSGAQASIAVGLKQFLNNFGGVGQSGWNSAATLTIRNSGNAVNEISPSVFGNLALLAPVIDQGGVVRAPLGLISFNNKSFGGWQGEIPMSSVVLRDGSLTSTSAAGLNIPFGGTTDGVSYQGTDGTTHNPGGISYNDNGIIRLVSGVRIDAKSLTGEAGAVIDVSGGGNLLGAGFINGRGGSINVLTSPLANAGPANAAYSDPGNKVFAILPGYASAYAPSLAAKGAGDPAIGQQITIPAGVPSLPAGTYTLLPSSYALLPGAYRIELGRRSAAVNAPLNLPNGSVLASAWLGVANTGRRDTLATQVILSSGKAVRSYSQFNETGYADFLRGQAALFDGLRPHLPADAGAIQITLGGTAAPVAGDGISFNGTALFGAAAGGFNGTLSVNAFFRQALDIVPGGQLAVPAAGHVMVPSDVINAFHAPALMLGGVSVYNDSGSGGDGGRVYFSGNENTVNLMAGAVLRAGQVFAVGNAINVAGGVVIDTRGLSGTGLDSTNGLAYSNRSDETMAQPKPAVLAVANGWYNFLPFIGNGSLRVDSGATLLTEGSIVLGAPGVLVMSDARLGARYLAVTQDVVNIGAADSLAAAQAAGHLSAGWNLTQDVLDRLLRPSTDASVPVLEQFTVVAGGSVNLIGDVALDAKSQSASGTLQFVVNTPAMYGLGGASEIARISTDAFVWNGIRTGNGRTGANGIPYGSKDPAVIQTNGPGTGRGRLEIDARTVVFGDGDHVRRTDGASLNRYAIGFINVDLHADDYVTVNNDGSLLVGQARDSSGTLVGGDLAVTTPLMTARQGAIMRYQAGNAISVLAPAGAAVDTSRVADMGGTLSLQGQRVTVDAPIALPSGRLTLDAVNDVRLGEHARIYLAGRHLVFYDKSVDSWGGDLVLRSAHGDIVQAGGSRIDVSATNNAAGSITAAALDATHGAVLFNGTLLGAAGAGYTAGQFVVQAQDLGDFAALNTWLNSGGFFGARGFDIRRGDLVVGNEVKAGVVSISVDGGSLTVNGTIDASGATPGTIRLAARDNLNLSSSAVLDTHAMRLKTDSRGATVDADNTAHIELSSVAGYVNLAGGATLDMRAADGVARGKLEIDARRLGGAGGGSGANDVAVNAGAVLAIKGAASIAVNGFRSYDLTGGSSIGQAWLDGAHADSRDFINAALGNSGLQARLRGMSAYGAAFHLRPGVEIRSDGTLSTTDDLDFVGYRYGPGANGAVPGSGEPGKLIIRAAGDLKINGSITDGFAPPPDTPDKNGFQTLVPRTVAHQNIFPTANLRLGEAWTIPSDSFYTNVVSYVADINGNLYFPGNTLPAGTTIDVSGLGSVPFGWESAMTVPALVIPGAPRPVYALAQLLASGSQSWSMRLVSGADTSASDSRALRSLSALNGAGNMTLSDFHTGGSDGKPVPSVVRTGTGDLELLVGGNYSQATPYGVYTAGTPIAQTGTPANAAYNPARGRLADDGTILGAAWPAYEATLGSQYMYYMEHGGDLLLSAQGNINGSQTIDTREVGSWLWRQGGAEIGQRGAWGINFGSYTGASGNDLSALLVHLSAFSGVGTLGGGNTTVHAGGNIGDSAGLVMAVGGSGRVMADGGLVQTGGGTLSVKVGGNVGTAGNQFVNLRGDINVATGDFGSAYGNNYAYDGSADPRFLDTLKTYSARVAAGGAFAPGDGAVNLRARGDIAMGDIIDPGRARLTQMTAGASPGQQYASWFSLWGQDTAINVFGAGGSVSPLSSSQGSQVGADGGSNVSSVFLPPILRATAGNGDMFLFAGMDGASLMLPSPHGQLQLLAAGSVIESLDQPYAFGPLASSMASLATPAHPAWARFTISSLTSQLVASNYWSDPSRIGDGVWNAYSSGYSTSGFTGSGGLPFVFGPNTVSDDSAFGEHINSSIYAMGGDILNVYYGQRYIDDYSAGGTRVYTAYYRAAKPVDIIAGGDIGNLQGMILHNDPSDVSTIAAAGNIIYAGTTITDGATQAQVAGLRIGGPGTLEVSAGRNLYQGANASIESVGALAAGDKRPGASVVLQVGVGAGLPGQGQTDWSGFARRYLDAANRAGSGALADQPGKVAKTYERELLAWLQARFGYIGSSADALSWFLALPAAQQRVFLRTVYYAELTAGGREYNDLNGPRASSYLRGRQAIASLFPNDGAYHGGITAVTAAMGVQGTPTYKIVSAYVHTDFGGDIQVLTPGGQVVIGSEGLAPGSDAGLITQGQGDIQVYAKGNLLLGLSRMMTTFGGDILAWSATGDINAGRGSKTSVIFTPPKVTYDDVGNVSLSPQVPSTGAGIATLAPIPEVPPGDVDLIAPLGTIDAGEAGIRVSGNVNIAALQVVNAANIQVQGKVTGLPVVAAVNVGALTNASAAASSAAMVAQDAMARDRAAARQNLPSVFTVRVLGFGSEPLSGDGMLPQVSPRPAQLSVLPPYNPKSALQLIGMGRELDPKQVARLTSEQRRQLQQDR